MQSPSISHCGGGEIMAARQIGGPGCALQEHGAYATCMWKIRYGPWARKPAWNFLGDMSHRVSWTDDQSRGSGGRPHIMWLSRGWETVSRLCFMCLRSHSAINITSLWIQTLLQTLFYSLYIPLRQESPHPFLTEVVYVFDFV